MRWVYVLATLLATAVLALDQASKQWAVGRLAGAPIEILPTVRLTLFLNDGASFSAGAGNGRVVGIFVIVIIGAVLRLIVTQRRPAVVLVLSVVLGGALGNLWDRIFRAEAGFLTGGVVDFIDVSWFAVFNVADTFVVVGALTYAFLEITAHRRRPGPADTADATNPGGTADTADA